MLGSIPGVPAAPEAQHHREVQLPGGRMAGNTTDAGRSVTSKVVAILLVFAHGTQFSLTEIARLTGLPMATAHRRVAELVSAGLLVRLSHSQYGIGPQLLRVAASPAAPSLHERARRAMEDLAEACPHGTVRLGVLDRGEVAYIEKRDRIRPASTAFGHDRLPVHATAVGKTLLAFLPPHGVDQVLAHGLRRYTAFTITQPEELLRELASIRITHVALACQELEPARYDVAAPVFGPGGSMVAALEMSLHQPQEIPIARPVLMLAARMLSRELHTAYRGTLQIGGDRQLDIMIATALLDSRDGLPLHPGPAVAAAQTNGASI
jgi:DNA-binding IclR family transcriptional regulator